VFLAHSKKTELIRSYPSTLIIILSIAILSFLALLNPFKYCIEPISTYSVVIRGHYEYILFFSYAYFSIGNPIAIVQFISDILAISLVCPRSEKIYGPWIIPIFFTANIIGAIFTLYINLLLDPSKIYIIYTPYIGNYPGVMALSILFALYRPRAKETLCVYIPCGIVVPYKSRASNIIIINFAISLCGFYYRGIPLNYVCFSSFFIIILYVYLLHRLIFNRALYVSPCDYISI